MRLCKYTLADEPDCLNIFDGNTPPFFAVRERASFLDYLKGLKPPCFHFVVRGDDANMLACGGLNFDAPKHSAYLRWDMVSRGRRTQRHAYRVGSGMAASAKPRRRRVQESQSPHARPAGVGS